MGSGIAMNFANAGIPVLLLDAKQAGLDRGMDHIRRNYENSVRRGSMPAARADKALSLIRTSLDYASAAGCDILAVYGRECDFLLEEGATPWQIDRALQAFGFPMGLYLMRDMSGLDVGWGIRKYREQFRGKSLRYSPIADRLCELGRFGQKSGKGYYLYEGQGAAAKATPDPEVEALIACTAQQLGIQRRTVTDGDVVDRVLIAMVNAGARILEEGVALRAGDIDVTYIYGYGFPRHHGGPMFWGERRGLGWVLEQVRRQQALQGKFWEPAAFLVQAAARGRWSE